MNIFNINVQKEELSMIFDSFRDAENYSTMLYLHKSKILFEDESDIYSAYIKVDLEQDIKKDKLVKQIINREYGSFLTTFLNADFTTVENAYNTFFVYYGLEGTSLDSRIETIDSNLYTKRYVSTKQFLKFYDKTYELIKDKYIEFQQKIREIIDYVYNLNQYKTGLNIDKYSKLMAYSLYVDIASYLRAEVGLRILSDDSVTVFKLKTLRQVDRLANKIAEGISNIGAMTVYSSNSHLSLIYTALNDLIKSSSRNFSICQNCGRYYLQHSGKEVYCDLPNLDNSPTCKTFASRKAYEERVVEDEAELAYKREYQRRITQVYRTDKESKLSRKEEFINWKVKARKELKKYRENKISSYDFCDWIEKNK